MYYIFTDGSSSRKNNSIGSAYVIYDENKELIELFNIGYKDKQARSGISELIAVYKVLSRILQNSIFWGKEIIIYSDSQYVVNELTIWFRDQLLKNFYNQKNSYLIIYILYLLYLCSSFHECKIKFQWIRGHQKEQIFECIGNNKADELAVSAHSDINKELPDVEELEFFVRETCLEEDIITLVKKYYLEPNGTF